MAVTSHDEDETHATSQNVNTSTIPLLGEHDADDDDRISHYEAQHEVKPLLQARLRLYWLATVLCCGALLFGYDSGLIGGVLTFTSFHADFRFGDYGPPSETTVSAIAVGTQQIGALIGCLAIWPVNNYRGRRMAIGVCSLVFCMGVLLELINGLSLSLFYLGRFIAGLGVGGSSSVIPIYLSEMAPREIRGQLGSCYQFMFTIGIFASYWIDYAVGMMASGSLQWQIPVALQLVPGGVMGIGVLTLHESVRWLSSRGEHEMARRSLEWIRANNSALVADELLEIRAGIEDEQREKAGLSILELFEWPNAHRILLAIGIFLAQQSTGATALAYFGPQFFALIVGPGDRTLLLTGIFGFVKVASCGMFILFMSDRFGRKTLLFTGAALMAICMFVTAALVRSITHGDSLTPTTTDSTTLPTTTITGIITVALIYLSIIFFNLSWGPLPWPYTSEIFPTRIRESGVTCGVSAQWFFNLVWSSATPFLLKSLGWATFLLFGVLDVCVMLFVVGCLKETARKTLEEINAIFALDIDN
ncbi:putative MFS quinate transporter [Talaromyces proteolyticus]|uniref:MFS quinate transporter n=1 Tax=Talaromyces proteolyticus TaxID=1131652 RepID=A0AAD4L7I2_9EURO|nr:putative MFS quinate transporter [Talaromyces proteolyticus]KAH8705394.1 putative MFS quinate transporter [Talaromyces proteolyticus]